MSPNPVSFLLTIPLLCDRAPGSCRRGCVGDGRRSHYQGQDQEAALGRKAQQRGSQDFQDRRLNPEPIVHASHVDDYQGGGSVSHGHRSRHRGQDQDAALRSRAQQRGSQDFQDRKLNPEPKFPVGI